jgi:hypothetical protein
MTLLHIARLSGLQFIWADLFNLSVMRFGPQLVKDTQKLWSAIRIVQEWFEIFQHIYMLGTTFSKLLFQDWFQQCNFTVVHFISVIYFMWPQMFIQYIQEFFTSEKKCFQMIPE